MSITSPKSRGNWHIGWQENKYESIFGHSGCQLDVGEPAKTRKDKCQNEDYDYSRRLDKVLAEYRDFKHPKDREKIKNEYFGRQDEYRNKVLRSEAREK
jgi:hypothetical protein